MGLPFFQSTKRRDQVLAVDLGSRTTKAVQLQNKGGSFVLTGYAVLDAPIFEKTLSAELLTEHLKAVTQATDAKTKQVALTMGVHDSVVRHTEMPRMPINDLRMVLKLNPKSYLQQELPNHLFDCHIGLQTQQPKGAEPGKTPTATPKHKVLVAGAKKQLVDDYVAGARGAGLVADHIVPGLIGPVNVFELAMPEVFSKEVVALVDLGFKSSSISILQEGELILSRVVAMGGDRLTNGLAEALNISYAEAEGIKVGMPTEVASHLESLLVPLGRELRASIDFFEHQQDRTVSQVYLTGGSARSEFIVQRLHQELMIECKLLNPTTFLQLELPPQQRADIDRVAPQLTVALGAALPAIWS
jgi:type IV pilus assembly protein PilM